MPGYFCNSQREQERRSDGKKGGDVDGAADHRLVETKK